MEHPGKQVETIQIFPFDLMQKHHFNTKNYDSQQNSL